MDAERRQVTVLFTDMVGFTSFSERSGEEAAYALMRSLSKLMGEAVREQGGVVQSFTGDGIMAVFGAPVAFEDTPLRACRAAVSILQRLRDAGGDLKGKHGVRPQLRIGLNSGLAVVGKVQDGTDAGVTVLGDTVNFAARLQALAQPDAIFVSEATHRLVQGLVECSFAGEHQIKGKSEPQKVYSLDAIRLNATRFDASVGRGLSTFVGREHELEVLERGLAEARSQLCVIDLVAEPGMGKSRLLHEFRERIGKERAFVLTGRCSPDGQQTPFLAFIEIVRASLQVTAGEAENVLAQKLAAGLAALGLSSDRNLGLLLHLLGLKAPEGTLTGLDGMLIGLRTRELLQQLLEARCQFSPVVMVLEDLHWIDSVSGELLAKIVDSKAKRLLLLSTRRPEYVPAWLDHAVVTKLSLEPLPADAIRRLVQARLGVEALPEVLARQLTEKAEGNPLFAEEMVSFLTERGVLRDQASELDFDASAVPAIPASVQSLLTARVDRLAAKDRSLLQAAAVIGRQFDPQLLAAAVGETDVDARLETMQALDLVRPEGKSNDYAFKHALVRDALFQSLLSEARTVLHLKVAEEIERRSGNRLAEVAEVLAHHYRQTERTEKAFSYLSMAGSKSLSVYSLGEAATYFTAALALLDKNPDCASDDQVAQFFVSYTLLLNMNYKIKVTIEILERYLSRIDRLGNDRRAILIRHHYVVALIRNFRFREAAAVQRYTSSLAERAGDSRSKAYSLAGEILVSTVVAPIPLHQFETLKKVAIEAASDTADAHIQNWTRGRINEARDAARELMRVGQVLKDPRSTGFGLWLLSWIALVCESYTEALEYGEQSLAVAIIPQDQDIALGVKAAALVLLRRTDEGAALLEDQRNRMIAFGDHWNLSGSDPILGVCKVLRGEIGNGIRIMEQAIVAREKEGYNDMADWSRMFLIEVLLQIVSGQEKLPFRVLLKNLPILLKVMATASSRIRTLTTRILANSHFDSAGQHIGRAQISLGLLNKIKKKHAPALQHLTEAQRIFSQFGHSPVLARVETALAELGQ